MILRSWARVCGLGVALALGVACATSPTGRKQLILIPDGQMTQLGGQAFQDMKAKQPVEKDSRANAYVNCVVQPLVKLLSQDEARTKTWEVVVFRDDSANAFALPGGKIGVHTGLLKVAKTPDQLAAVLGHEVGHVMARHGGERMSQGVLAQAGLTLTQVMTEGSKHQGLILGALGLGTQVGVLLPFSRTQESEADRIGIDLMARAGFDPRQSVELWKNMIAANGKGGPEFMSTHPASENRIRELQEQMGPALEKFERVPNTLRPKCVL